MKDERDIGTAQQTKPPTEDGLGLGGAWGRAYTEAVPEEPAVPVGRLALLLVPPRDHVRDARGQRVRGPPEPQGGRAGVDHHDEVALYLLKEAQRARSQSESPRPPGALPALPHPPSQAFKRPSPGRARPSGEGAAPEQPPLSSGPHLLQGLGHGGGDDGPLHAALFALPVALLVFAVLRLAFLRLGHAPAGRKPRLPGPRGAEPGAGRKRAGPGPAPPLEQVPGAGSAAPGRCPGWPRL